MSHSRTSPASPLSRFGLTAARAGAVVTLLSVLFGTGSVLAQTFIRGRVNPDDQVDLADAVSILGYLFLGDDAPACLKTADVNDDGTVTLTDAVFLLGFLFLGDAPIPPPYPAAGLDPTADDLHCPEGRPSELAAGPSPVTLSTVGQTAQLAVTGKVDGLPVDLHEGSTGTSYSSSDPRVIGVYRDGLVEARAPGSAAVTVRNGGLEAAVLAEVSAQGASTNHHVLAVNDLGMNYMDREFSIFSIFPPFNVVLAQVARTEAAGKVTLLDGGQVELRYSPVPDARGSLNSASLRKTSFWESATELFGTSIEPGMGLVGLYMPDDAPSAGPQPLAWEAPRGWFGAAGIPITALDDAGENNPYPLSRVTAFDRTTGVALAHADVVVPVSQEIDCRNCHATGQVAARVGFIHWWKDDDIEVQTKKNILTIHDYRSRTTLLRSTPVLCGSCHYSRALDLANSGPNAEQQMHSSLSMAMHAFHGVQTDGSGTPLFPPGAPPEQTCFNCHPGKTTQCQRGAMWTGGMDCGSCHGDMLSVGAGHPLAAGGSLDGTTDGAARRAWVDEPRCQSCHTGDALDHLAGPEYEVAADGLRLRQAYRKDDSSAAAILASNKRFAENDGALYRFSKGHGGILCENCHGSAHAEWPNADASHSDNIVASELQGHTGTIEECAACHAPESVALGLNGPHNLHTVNDLRWVRGQHGNVWENNQRECQACHGADLKAGSVLAKAAADRVFRIEDDQTVRIAKGQLVTCILCHSWPKSDD